MAEYDNKLRFVLFRNKDKRNDKDADFNGTFTDEDGREYFMDAWSQTPKNGGDKFLSGKVKLKQARTDAPRAASRAPALNDEVPF